MMTGTQDLQGPDQQPADEPMEKVRGFMAGTLALVVFVCGMEMVPGWGILGLGWPVGTFYAIAAVVGVVCGAVMGGRYWPAGAIAGGVGAAGALFAIGLLLHLTSWTHTVLLLVAGVLGAMPGIGLGLAAKAIQDTLFPPLPDDAMPTSVTESDEGGHVNGR